MSQRQFVDDRARGRYQISVSPCARCGSPRTVAIRRLPARLRLVVLLVPFAVGWLVGAPLVSDVLEGVDRTHLPLWRLWTVLAAVVCATLAAIARVRRPVCPRCARRAVATIEPVAAEHGTTRRTILKATTAAAAATVSGAAGIVLPN